MRPCDTQVGAPDCQVPADNSSVAAHRIGASFADSMQRATLTAFVGVEVALGIVAAVASPAGAELLILLFTALAVAAGLTSLLWNATSFLLVGAFYGLIAYFYFIAATPDGPLISVLIPFTSWTVAMPVMLRAGVRATMTSVLLSACFGAIVLLSHPKWDEVALASIITNLTTVGCAVAMMTFLRRAARTIDRVNDLKVHEELRAVRARALNERTAEYIRMLHDTVVNTFGALARETSYLVPSAEVQERCRDDVERIRAFQGEGKRPHRPDPTALGSHGFPVRWSGDSRGELSRCQDLLADDTLNALYGCMNESIRNAEKHSGSGHVVCEAQLREGALHVTIRDDGRGFDRSVVVERGIATSLFARARAAGIAVELDTAPGCGATVRLVSPLERRPGAASSMPSDGHASTHDFTLRFGVAWTTLALAIGLVLTLATQSARAIPAGALFVVLMGVVCLTWLVRRRGGEPPVWLTALLLTAVPVVNSCALLSVDYGRAVPYLFPAIALTAMPMLLYGATAKIALFVAAAVVQTVSLPLLTWIVGGADLTLRALILEGPVFIQLAALCLLLTMFARVVRQHAQTERELIQAKHESMRQEAETEVRRRWSAANLQRPFQLLRELATGGVSVTDPETRRRCAEEEAWLRQISAFPPDAAVMSSWFARVLAEARERAVTVQLRVEQGQIDDPGQADAFGELMLYCIGCSPAGSELTISLLPCDGSTHLLIVGDGGGRLAERIASYNSDRLAIRCTEILDQTLLEATVIMA